jgi:hypothetical protein
MALVQEYGIGRNAAATCAVESTFNESPNGTTVTWVDTDSLKLQNYKFEPNFERKDRLDTRATRSVLEQIEGPIETSWNCESWLLPRGGTTPPDADPLFLCAMGVGAANAGGYEYSLSPSQNLPRSLRLLMSTSSFPAFGEAVLGAIVQEMKISAASGDEPKVAFSGVAARHVLTGRSTAVGTVDGSGTPVSILTVAAGQGYQFPVGSLIQVGTSVGHYVTASTSTSITIAPSITTNEGAAPVIRPYTPYSEAQTGGSPIPEIRGSISSSTTGVTVPFGIESFELTLANNFSTVRPMFNQTFVDAIPGNRMVTGSIRLWGQAQDIIWAARATRFNETDINPIQLTINLGAVGLPGMLSIQMPAVKFHPTGMDVPDAEEAKFTLNFTALGTGAGDNELLLRWT